MGNRVEIQLKTIDLIRGRIQIELIFLRDPLLGYADFKTNWVSHCINHAWLPAWTWTWARKLMGKELIRRKLIPIKMSYFACKQELKICAFSITLRSQKPPSRELQNSLDLRFRSSDSVIQWRLKRPNNGRHHLLRSNCCGRDAIKRNEFGKRITWGKDRGISIPGTIYGWSQSSCLMGSDKWTSRHLRK